MQISVVGYFVLLGERPTKPANASAIGLCDPLWTFAQRCWDGNMELRPKAGEVVASLGEAAACWDGLMPPLPHDEGVSYGPEETSNSKKTGGFENLTPLP